MKVTVIKNISKAKLRIKSSGANLQTIELKVDGEQIVNPAHLPFYKRAISAMLQGKMIVVEEHDFDKRKDEEGRKTTVTFTPSKEDVKITEQSEETESEGSQESQEDSEKDEEVKELLGETESDEKTLLKKEIKKLQAEYKNETNSEIKEQLKTLILEKKDTLKKL